MVKCSAFLEGSSIIVDVSSKDFLSLIKYHKRQHRKIDLIFDTNHKTMCETYVYSNNNLIGCICGIQSPYNK